jgi:hypothetical protein
MVAAWTTGVSSVRYGVPRRQLIGGNLRSFAVGIPHLLRAQFTTYDYSWLLPMVLGSRRYQWRSPLSDGFTTLRLLDAADADLPVNAGLALLRRDI